MKDLATLKDLSFEFDFTGCLFLIILIALKLNYINRHLARFDLLKLSWDLSYFFALYSVLLLLLQIAFSEKLPKKE